MRVMTFTPYLIWILILCVCIVNGIRYWVYHKKLFKLLKEKDPQLWEKLANAPARYRQFVFAGDGSEDEEIEYLRIMTRGSLKMCILFVVIFFGFMFVVALWKT